MTNNSMIFYSKFHCKLNFITSYSSFSFFVFFFYTSQLIFCRFWSTAKYYTFKGFKYNLKSLFETVLIALHLVIISCIFYYYQYCIRIMAAYCSELEYITKYFTDVIYSSHKQKINKS